MVIEPRPGRFAFISNEMKISFKYLIAEQIFTLKCQRRCDAREQNNGKI